MHSPSPIGGESQTTFSPIPQQQDVYGSRPQTPLSAQSFIQQPPPQQQQIQQPPQQGYPQYGLYPQVQPLNGTQFDQMTQSYPQQGVYVPTQQQQYQGYPQQHYPQQYPPQQGYPQQQQDVYGSRPQTPQQYIPPQQQHYVQQQQQQQQYIQQQPYGQPSVMQPLQPQQQPTFVQTTTVTEKTFIPGSNQSPIQVVQTTTTKTVPPPIKGSMMQSVKLQVIEQAAKAWLKKRMQLIEILQNMITSLDKKQQSSSKTKVGGTVSNIVGASLIVGGIIAAPFTMGGSLLASGAGLTAIAGGTTATIAASVSEWKFAKNNARLAQDLLHEDTQAVNNIIAKIYDYRNIDQMAESRSIVIGTVSVNIAHFVNALIGSRVQTLDQSEGLTNDNTGVASLASLMIKGAVPIVSIPVDMVLLVKEQKKANGKEPSKLALKIIPVLETIKIQTRSATGLIV